MAGFTSVMRPVMSVSTTPSDMAAMVSRAAWAVLAAATASISRFCASRTACSAPLRSMAYWMTRAIPLPVMDPLTR